MKNNISNKVNAMLQISGKSRKDFAEFLGIKYQSLSNKLQLGYFSLDDMIRLMEFTDGALYMECNGTRMEIGKDCLKNSDVL